MRYSAIAAVLFLIAIGVRADTDAGERLTLQQTWSNYFAEDEVTLNLTVPPAVDGRVTWRLAVGARTLARGEQPIERRGDGPGACTVQFVLPQLKEGVTVAAELTLTAGTASEAAFTSRTLPLWIFHRNAFSDCDAWLRSLNLYVFDPDETTAPILEAHDVPFSPVGNPDALATLTKGIVVVGEGINFQEWPALSRLLFETAARGLNVICLAPAESDIVLPMAFDTELPKSRRITFERTDIIERLDKHLDHKAWADDGRIARSSFDLQGRQDVVAAVQAEDEGDWTWIELDYSPGGGRVMLCGFAIMEKWEQSPTPRYLLRRIFEHVRPNREKKPKT